MGRDVETRRSLEKRLNRLRKQGRQGQLLLIENVEETIHDLKLDNVELHCIFRPRKNDGAEHFLPSLSYSFVAGELIRYSTRRMMEDALKQNEAWPITGCYTKNYHSHETQNYIILWRGDFDTISEHCINLLGRIMETMLDSSLYIANLQRDARDEKIGRLRKLLDGKDTANLKDLCGFILQATGFPAGAFGDSYAPCCFC